PRSAVVAREVADLAGGVAALVARAVQLGEQGDGRTACELIEMAVQAAPDDAAVHQARCALYAQRRREATSLMGKGIFEATARGSAEAAGIPVPEMSRVSPLA